jgi:hypothetical protein
MIKPPKELIDKFMEWFHNDNHSINEDYYKNIITKEFLSSMSKSDFIDFFTEFAAVGGKIQSGGHRTKNLFRKTISDKYDSFKAYILSAFEPNFKVNDWLESTKNYNYFGSGLATIFLNRVDKKRFLIVNDKTEDSLELFGIKLPVKLGNRYEEVRKAQMQLIDWFPEIDNFFRADALNEFLIGQDEGKKLAKKILRPNHLGKRFWVCGLGEGARFWEECKTNNTVVFGLDELASLSIYKSKEELKSAIVQAGLSGTNPTNDTLAGWQFANEIKEGDVIIAKKGIDTYLGYGIVAGPYRHDSSRISYRNVIPVAWKDTGEWKETEGRIALKTLTDITPYPDYVQKLIRMMNIQMSESSNSINKSLSTAENLILYGPPGTGKTYNLTKYFKDYTASNSGESEESYLARLVADKPWWQIVGAAVLEMDRIKVRDLLKHRLVLAKLSQSDIKNPGARLWATLQSHTVQECEQVNYQKRLYPQVFWKDASSVWSIKAEQLTEVAPEIIELQNESKKVPSTETVKRYEFVTFHQSYGYEEFVEGIRPITDTEDDDESGIKFRIEPGVFKRVCQRAEKDPSNNYAIFIDEINRGNISKIFGELITLVELDKRIGAKNELRVKLPYSKPEFGVPANLSVIGTMNTADRSIAFIDIALRRRFQFKEMMPDLDLIEKIVGTIGGVDVKALLGTINRRIEFLYDRDHMIGHSYFLECRSLVDLRDTLLKNIIPLLQEYFYGDWEKICLVLGCGNNGNGGSSKNPYPVIKAEKLVEKDILGFDHQDYDDCYRYEVKPEFIESTGEMLERFLVSLYKDHSKKADNTDE